MASTVDGPQLRRHDSTRLPGEKGGRGSSDSIASRDTYGSMRIPSDKGIKEDTMPEEADKEGTKKQHSSRFTLGEAFSLGGTFNACQ